MTQYKALALISGGLDSLLAAKTIQAQGIHVEGINFYTGFCVEGHTHAIRKKDQAKMKRNNALWVAETLNIPLHIMDVVEEYKQVVYQPKFGYGKHLNPCLDCKVFMVGKAHEWILEHGFDFIITGEVIGQRPKSQRRDTMNVVKKHSGAQDRLLRPLSAKLFPPTLPERMGWVDRDKLFDIHGRGRSRQLEMAKNLGISDFAQPAGGCCFLTDKYYSAKLLDLWQANGTKQYELDDIMLLKIGRHLRPKPHFKLILGREEGENNFLSGYRKQFTHMSPQNCHGPFGLIDGVLQDASDYELAAKILARFCKPKRDLTAPLDNSAMTDIEKPDTCIEFTHPSGEKKQLNVSAFTEADIPKFWYVEQNLSSQHASIPTEIQLNLSPNEYPEEYLE